MVQEGAARIPARRSAGRLHMDDDIAASDSAGRHNTHKAGVLVERRYAGSEWNGRATVSPLGVHTETR